MGPPVEREPTAQPPLYFVPPEQDPPPSLDLQNRPQGLQPGRVGRLQDLSLQGTGPESPWLPKGMGRYGNDKLGPPARCQLLPFLFLGEGSPTKIDYSKQGTLILTSLLEDLANPS